MSTEQRRLRSDWADVQADLSLCWAHRSFCWFCNVTAHMYCLGHPVSPGEPGCNIYTTKKDGERKIYEEKQVFRGAGQA